jgi:hypothetical protein
MPGILPFYRISKFGAKYTYNTDMRSYSTVSGYPGRERMGIEGTGQLLEKSSLRFQTPVQW